MSYFRCFPSFAPPPTGCDFLFVCKERIEILTLINPTYTVAALHSGLFPVCERCSEPRTELAATHNAYWDVGLLALGPGEGGGGCGGREGVAGAVGSMAHQ